MQELRRVSEEELRAVEGDLQREVAEDGELRSKYGQRWTRPASVALNSQITEKIAGGTSKPSEILCLACTCSKFLGLFMWLEAALLPHKPLGDHQLLNNASGLNLAGVIPLNHGIEASNSMGFDLQAKWYAFGINSKNDPLAR